MKIFMIIKLSSYFNSYEKLTALITSVFEALVENMPLVQIRFMLNPKRAICYFASGLILILSQ